MIIYKGDFDVFDDFDDFDGFDVYENLHATAKIHRPIQRLYSHCHHLRHCDGSL